MKIANKIIKAAENKKQLKELSEDLKYSNRQTQRITKKIFNMKYKRLQRFLLISEILDLKKANKIDKEIADMHFKGDVSNYYHFKRKFKKEMASDIEILKMEIKVLKKLSKSRDTNKNITLKNLGATREVIISLRDSGFHIISVPGRYNSGYNLANTQEDICLSWINNIRTNRFNLKADYTFK